ncbi:hypothetical protein FA15DRAFT_655853 [Coprinopsis marcescibilis]|uniref:Fungal-type protein kinase domain-containing protein n=1 Tax=Coprinopsis marcescibilis TaxID=230819 RepID=A0A5C3KV46_COPMA|nr:hypothetical protein FA15DRAFT_655853 [Coprinopsis marcescibilis]
MYFLLAHAGLIERSILHRDISTKNILLGRPNKTRKGCGGVLIDMDMAIWYNKSRKLPRPTIEHSKPNPLKKFVHPHDHMDDLESFFYILYYLAFCYTSSRIVHAEVPSEVKRWDSADPHSSMNNKKAFVFDPLPDFGPISPFWGKAVRKLLTGFHSIIRAVVWEKGACTTAEEADASRAAQVPKYNEILDIFRIAIQEHAKEIANAPPVPVTQLPQPEPSVPVRPDCPSLAEPEQRRVQAPALVQVRASGNLERNAPLKTPSHGRHLLSSGDPQSNRRTAKQRQRRWHRQQQQQQQWNSRKRQGVSRHRLDPLTVLAGWLRDPRSPT